jgi:protein SCO1
MPKQASKIGSALLAGGLLFALAPSVCSAVTPEAYRDIGVSVPLNAAVPPEVAVTDGRGYVRDLRTLISRPTVLVFADYTCTNLCGPVVAFVASALTRSGLAADQYRMMVVGLDPNDGAAAAGRMRHDYLGDDAALNKATTFAIADQATVRRLTAALGYRYAYDKDHDQFIHPAAAFVLGSDGRVVRVLTGLGLSGSDVRLALVEASAGRIGSFSDRVRLICSGFDPTQGVYNLVVSRLLAVTGIATVLTLGGLVGVLMLVSRRRTA